MKKVILGLMFVFLVPFISTHAMTASEEQQLIQTLLQQIASLQAQLQVLISQGATATPGRVMNSQQLPPDDGTLTGSGSSAPIFKAGDTVSVKLDHLNVRATPYGRTLGFQLIGALGTVFNGPQRAGDNTNWWQISYKNGISGWSIESGLEKTTATAGQITGTCSITSFTANGSSYTNSPINIYVPTAGSMVQTTLNYIANGCNRIELVQTTNGVSSSSIQPDTGYANIIVNPFFISWTNVTGADSSTYTLKGYSHSNTSVPSDVKTIQLNKTSTANNLQNTAMLVGTPTIMVSSGTISQSSLQTLTATFNVSLKALNGSIQMPNSGGFSFRVYKDGAVVNTTSPVSLTYSVPSYGVVTAGVTPNTFVIPENNQTTVPVTFVMQGTNSNGTLIPQGQYSVVLAGVQPVSGTVSLSGSNWMTSPVNFPTGQTPNPILGDVNGDGRINCDDAQMVSQYSVGLINLTTEQRIRADVNGDGVVNIIDAQQIARNNNLSCAITPSIPIPSAPTNVAVLTGPQCGGQIAINWVGSSGATGYKIYRDSRTNLLNTITNAGTDSYTFLDAVNVPSSAHSYYVSAYNSFGESIATGSGNAVSASSACTSVSAPTVSLTINSSFGSGSNTATAGTYKVLDWSSTNANSCQASGGWSGYKATSGSQSVGPINQTTTYTVTCTGAGGTNSASVTINVGTTQVVVPTVSVSVAPTSITAGQSATITWSSTNSTNCDVSNIPGGAVAAFTYGTLSVSPTQTRTYNITCYNSAGQSTSGSATITLAPVITPVPTVHLSINSSYYLGASTLPAGSQTILDWSSTNATTCNAPWLASGYGAGPGSQTVGPIYQATTYTLTCTGPGGSSSASVTINILAPTATAPSAPTGLTATPGACGTGKINLSWSSVPNVIYYSVYGGNNAFYGGMPLQVSLPGTVASYVDSGATSASTGFTPGNAYSYYVTARNSIGESSPSNTASAVAPSACPTNTTNSSTGGAGGGAELIYNGQTNLAGVQAGFDALLRAFQEFVNQGSQ